jgi:DNA-directed RNA polymerase
MIKTTQFELEAQMQDRGYARFLKQIEAARKNEGQSNTAYGRELIKANIDDVVVAIGAFIDTQATVKRKAPASILLNDLNLEAVAYLALKTIVNSLGHDEAKTTATAINIGLAVSNAIKLAELSADKESKGLVKHIETSAKRALGNDNSKEKAVSETLAFFNMQSAWSVEDQLKVGITLVELIAASGLIENITVGSGKSSFNKLVPTDKTMEMVEVMNLCPEFAPVYLPMIVEPKDWDTDGNGGYLTLRQPLVKTRFEGHTEALQGG